MVRKLMKSKKQEATSTKEIDNQIEKGLEFIKQYCGDEYYKKYYDLSLDTSIILVEVMRKINEAYKLSILNNNKERLRRLNNFIGHSKTMIKLYEKEYHPSSPMIVFSCLFLLNKYFEQYIGINNFNTLFDSDNFKDLLYNKRCENFENALMIEPKSYDVAFNDIWIDKFKSTSDKITDCLLTVMKYQERYYSSSLGEQINDFIMKYDFVVENIEDVKHLPEHDLCIDINRIILVINDAVNSNYFLEYLKEVKHYNPLVAENDYHKIKEHVNDIKDFIESFTSLVITGQEEIEEETELKAS